MRTLPNRMNKKSKKRPHPSIFALCLTSSIALKQQVGYMILTPKNATETLAKKTLLLQNVPHVPL